MAYPWMTRFRQQTVSSRQQSEFLKAKRDKAPLDITQRLEQKLATYNASENVYKRWLFEILSWTLSAVCMGAVIGIYLYVNGKSMAWSDTLLNMANVLGKVASAALIIPTSEALGQLKWNWFHNSQAMWDFEIFDKASRGPWGATLLLLRTKGRSLAALGALLIVFLLAIDTFFQQVVTHPDQWILHPTPGEIPRLTEYNPAYRVNLRRGMDQDGIDRTLSPIVLEFLYGNGTQPVKFGTGTRPGIPLSCPTSNCTWPDYETLAICSDCAEVSHILDIQLRCMNTTIDWSVHWDGPLRDVPYPYGTICGHWLNATSDSPTLLNGYVLGTKDNTAVKGEALMLRGVPLTGFFDKKWFYGDGSVAFKNMRNTLFNSLIASAPAGPASVYAHEKPFVHECVLSWCVQTLRSHYDNGEYQEEVLSSFHNTTAGTNPWIAFELALEQGGGTFLDYLENVSIKHPPVDPKYATSTIFDLEYTLSNSSATSVSNIFDDFFPFSYTVDTISSIPQLRSKNYQDGPSIMAVASSQWQFPNNVTVHMQRMATAMTNAMRSSTITKRHMLQGHAYFLEKSVHVRWEWLSFPFLLLVLTLVFLVSTIIKTSRDPVTGAWKNSAMPTLIYGLPQETRGQLSSASTWHSAEQNKKTRIRLLPNMGWRVSGQNQLCTSPQLPRPAVQAPRGWI